MFARKRVYFLPDKVIPRASRIYNSFAICLFKLTGDCRCSSEVFLLLVSIFFRLSAARRSYTICSPETGDRSNSNCSPAPEKKRLSYYLGPRRATDARELSSYAPNMERVQ